MKSIFLFLWMFGFNAITLFGFDYGGFHLNDTVFQNDPEHQENLRATFRKQIDVVNSVKFSPTLLALLHQIPIIAVVVNDQRFIGKKNYIVVERYRRLIRLCPKR